MENKYLRPDQVAQILCVNIRTVYRMIRDGDITAFKVRGVLRVTKKSLNQYIEQQISVFSYENGIENTVTRDDNS